jgi:predicted amidohydrolase
MTDASILKVAAAQYPIDKLSTIGACRAKLAQWVGEAAGNGAQLLVFPEYGAMEYAAAQGERIAGDIAMSLAAVSDALGEMHAAYSELARQHRVYILASSGPSRRPDGRYVNEARLFAPSGGNDVQEKLIMTPFEQRWGISGGTALKVFDATVGRIGVAICYDSEFPLLVRAQAEAGADIILIPSCTEFISGYNRVRTAALARALENTCVTIISSTVGDALWSPVVDRNVGAAGIFVPAERTVSETGILAEGSLNAKQWVYASFDLNPLQTIKRCGEMRNATDWTLQPGATPLADRIKIVPMQ